MDIRIPEGFTEWVGTDNPAPGEIVRLSLVTGYVTGPRRADDVRWRDAVYQACVTGYQVVSP